MAKINFASTLRRVRESTRYEITDPELTEPTVVFLRALDGVEDEAAMEKAQDYIRTFITGGWINKTGNLEPKPRVFQVDGEVVSLNRNFFSLASRLSCQMTDEGDQYSVEELVQMAVKFPVAWRMLNNAATEVEINASRGKASLQEKQEEPPTS